MEKMTNNRTESKKTASEASRAGDWGRFLLIPRSHGILLPKCTRLLVHLPPPPSDDPEEPGSRLSECVTYLSCMSPTTTAAAGKPSLK